MVTTEEFVRHLVNSAVVMLPGLLAVLYVRRRWDTGYLATKRIAIAYVGVLGAIALLSRGSVVRERRCLRDPEGFCRFNDSVPFMALLAVGYLVTALITARVMYTER